MNQRIYQHLLSNLSMFDDVSKDTVLSDLPWDDKQQARFRNVFADDFKITDPKLDGTLEEAVNDCEEKWIKIWFSGGWTPRTDIYEYTGWKIVDVINAMDPRKVLDVGCGFHPFKDKIKNIIGIDKYNSAADVVVDILDYEGEPESYDAIIAFGSINFGTYDDIERAMKKVFGLLAPGGRLFMRVNYGFRDRVSENKGYNWIDLYPWDIETATKLANDHNVKLIAYKRDNGHRDYIEYAK